MIFFIESNEFKVFLVFEGCQSKNDDYKYYTSLLLNHNAELLLICWIHVRYAIFLNREKTELDKLMWLDQNSFRLYHKDI